MDLMEDIRMSKKREKQEIEKNFMKNIKRENMMWETRGKKKRIQKGDGMEGVKVKIPSFQGNNDPKVP